LVKQHWVQFCTSPAGASEDLFSQSFTDGVFERRTLSGTCLLNDRSWHIATFRCAAEFDRYRGIADIEQAAPITRDHEDTPWDHQGYSRTRQKVAPRTGD